MTPPNGAVRQPRVCIRFPFDISFPPIVPVPVGFVADGTAQPPGGPGITVQGALYDLADVAFAAPLSNTLTVNVMQGIWSMGPFTQAGTVNPMGGARDYALRVRLMQGGVELSNHVITVRVM